MAKYTSGRQKNLKVGISSYSENLTSLEVIGLVGIGTTNAGGRSLYVIGNAEVSNVVTATQFSTGFITATNLYVAGVGTFISSGLKIRNPANTFGYTIAGGAIAADYTLTLPTVTSNTGIAVTGLDQSFTGTQTFTSISASSAINFNTTASTILIGTGQTTPVLTLGGASQTGTMTLGQSTVSQTTNIQAGASGVGTTKTINFGTGGLSGSFTQINIGPTAGVGTVVINSGTNLGIGTTNPTSKLTVQGDVKVSGVVTATSFVGALTGIAASATQLVNPRNFSITGNFVTATAISFDGTGNVALAATITPDSIGLGTYTSGDYVKNISGTSNQISVSATSGEGSTPTLSIPNQFTVPQDLTVTRDVQVNRNLNVTGNITIGGTTAFINVQQLQVSDPDIVLGFRTDAFGNDVSNDNTAKHGGIAIASTEGNPLVSIYNPGIGESTLPTYKKIMWFPTGSFTGLGTDAWLINYAVGIGSTQFPTGTRLAAGSVQFTQSDLAVVRNINASGVITATSGFSGNASSATYATNAGIATYATFSGIATYATSSGVSTSVIGGIGSITQLQVTGVSTFTNGPVLIGAATSTGTASQLLQVGSASTPGGAYVSGNLGIGQTNPLGSLQIGAATSTFIVTGVGSVGIGTTNPTRRVHIFGDASTNQFNAALSIMSTNTVGYGVYFGLNATSITSGRDYRIVNNGTLDTAGVGKFSIYDVTAAKDRLVIDSSGSVGIGTTNPQATLQVKDALAFETTNTTTTSTSQVAVDTFATATFRSAKYQVQITCPGQLTTLGGITTGGSGYTAGTFNVTFTTSSGTGSAAQGTLVISNGTVNQIGIGTTGGSGYVAGDVLTASGGSGLQVSVGSTDANGSILTLGAITSAGVGYTAGVGVGTTTLTFLGGTGTGAVGLATIYDGVITSATLLQQPTTGTGGTVYYSGSNYTTSSVLTIAKSDVTNTITGISGSVGVSTFTSLTAHGIGVSDAIRVSSTSNGLTAGTDYYVVTVPSTTTFTLGSSVGIGTTFTTGSSLSIGFYRNSAIAGAGIAYSNAITGVSTNYQVSDLLVLQNGTTADYVEYAGIANNDILGTFAADISGANARLLLTPTYPNNNVKVARQVMTV